MSNLEKLALERIIEKTKEADGIEVEIRSMLIRKNFPVNCDEIKAIEKAMRCNNEIMRNAKAILEID